MKLETYKPAQIVEGIPHLPSYALDASFRSLHEIRFGGLLQSIKYTQVGDKYVCKGPSGSYGERITCPTNSSYCETLWTFPSNTVINSHFHRQAESSFCVEGRCVFEGSNWYAALHKGHVVHLDPFKAHSCFIDAGTVLVVRFQPAHPMEVVRDAPEC